MIGKAAYGPNRAGSKSEFKDKEKPTQIRNSNIIAAKGKYNIS